MQLKVHMITIEDLVPMDHFLRKLEAALDLSFVYEETKTLYSLRYGRPPIDPVVIVKYLLVGFLYGIPSERQIEQRIHGLGRIGRVAGRPRGILGTSERLRRRSEKRTGAPAREKLRQGKQRVKCLKQGGRRSHKRVSRTDPEAGHMNRPGKPVGQHYLSHQTLDTDHGIILDVAVTPGDVSDNVPYLDQMERIHKNVIPIQAATADAAYDFSLAHRVLDDMGTSFFVRPKPRPNYSQTTLQPDAFYYDKEHDIYICPNGKTLRLAGLHRDPSGLSLQYRPDKQDCLACPMREQCMMSEQRVRLVGRSYFHSSAEKNFSRRNKPEYTDALRKRQIWCEGTFAAQKRGHNLKYLLRRDLEAAEDHCLLSATAINLKRMIQAAG